MEVPELRVLRRDLIESHLGDELLELEWISREERHAPLPGVEADGAGDDLKDTTSVAAPDGGVAEHELAAFLERKRVPVFPGRSPLVHRIEADVGHVGRRARIQTPLYMRRIRLR